MKKLEWKPKKRTDCDYEVILDEMEPARKVTADGKGVFENRHVEFDWMALASAIDFPPEISRHQIRLITASGVFDAAGIGPLTAESVITAIENQTKEFLRIHPRKFLIATSLSIRYNRKLHSRKYLGSGIRFLESFPKKVELEQNWNSARQAGLPQIPDDYCRVLVSVQNREIFGAMESATKSLDLLRGIWNYELNRRTGLQYYSGPDKPVNPILMGPLHTIHEASGVSADETYWYEATFPQIVPKAIDVANSLDGIFNTERGIRRSLGRSKVGNHAIHFLCDYARALDSGDLYKSYVSLWSLLERLTLTAERDSYDITVRRASFLWRRPKSQLNFMNYLRVMRNEIIHRGEMDQPVKELIQPLRFSVETLLRFWVVNPFRFKTKDDFSRFLDLSTSVSSLSEELRLRKYAQRFLGSKPKKPK